MPDEPRDRTVSFRPEAKIEVFEAFSWYEERNPDAADRFDEQLRSVISSIARRPAVFPHYPRHSTARFARLKGFPYLVIYRELEEEIEIVAVAHARRQPLYWNPRLDRDPL